MHTATARHRNKRPLQPAITSYFPRQDDDDSNSDSEYDDLRGLNPNTRPRPQHHARAAQPSHKETLTPQVPGHVQSDLLQVGMRVRKSVPEGYKTHNNKMMALPSITTTLSNKPSSSSSTTTMTLDVKPPRGPVPTDVLHQRELLPFCGLHKLGGYAEQPTTNIHLYTDSSNSTSTNTASTTCSLPPPNHFPFHAETFSQPFHTSSSQDSGYESPPPLHPGKRAWHDEDEIRIDLSGGSAFLFGGRAHARNVDEVPVSPLSEMPENMLPAVRRYKQPKSRRQKEMMGEEGEERVVVVGSASDFEEADFLGGDVDMGGV